MATTTKSGKASSTTAKVSSSSTKASATATKPKKAAAPAAAKATDTAAPKKAPVRRAKPAVPAVDQEIRRRYIEVAAYYIAERRGFLGGRADEDWTQAEKEIDQLLADNKLTA